MSFRLAPPEKQALGWADFQQENNLFTCALTRWLQGVADDKPSLAAWPAPRKAGWVEHVNAPQSESELAAIRRSVERGNPFGKESWSDRAIRPLGLESTLRPRGRSKKLAEKGS